MKKRVLSVLMVLVLVLSFSLVTAVPVAAAESVVWVDGAWAGTITGDDPDGDGPATSFGTDAFATIQEGIGAANGGDTIIVAAGTYAPFTVETKTNLTVQSSGVVTVEGAQSVEIAYPSTYRDCVVFVKDSTNIVLDGLDIEGLSLGDTNPKNYGVIYDNSSGTIKNCTVSPNTIEDMNSVAIGIWDGSDVIIDTCTIHNFGRLGMLIYNACTASVLDNTIIGQVYSGEGDVSYGIEVEALDADSATASQVTIRGNEIYNCDNTTGPTWESAAILINGWLEHNGALEADCTVIMEKNDIHDNYIGIYAIKTPSSYAHTNNIYDNRVYGVISADASDASNVIFDATYNWWGDAGGPGMGGANPVSENVAYNPWLNAIIDFTPAGGATDLKATYTATPPPVIGISVTPSVDFGAVVPGLPSSGTPAVIVTNTGDLDVDLTAEIKTDSTPPVYAEGLKIDGLAVDAWTGSAAVDANSGALTLVLTVPTGTAAGTYDATLVFWAEMAP